MEAKINSHPEVIAARVEWKRCLDLREAAIGFVAKTLADDAFKMARNHLVMVSRVHPSNPIYQACI
jgi:hypothetical protein